MVLFDGRNRLDALELIGEKITLDNGVIFERFDADSIDITERVISLNIHRRHLTAKRKRDLIAKLLTADPSKPDRQIAETVKVSHHTVGGVRAKMEARGQLAHVETHTDSKGRRQPARKAGKGGSCQQTEKAKAAADKPKPRDDIGPNGTNEAERLRVRVEELQAEKRRLEINIIGLEGEIADLRGKLATGTGESISAV